MTQHPTKPHALYEDIRPATDKKNVYVSDLDAATVDEVWERFLSALNPLHEAGKLGALLFQFPHWFPISASNKRYILDCAKRAAPLRICVEFRQPTWMNEENRVETLQFLEGHDLAYVCVDMPQGFKSSVPPVVAATSDLAVVRFHGHNAEEWESGSVQRRFAYLYPRKELEEWAPRLRKLASEAEETHVLMNNCYSSYAQQNARELAELLKHGV